MTIARNGSFLRTRWRADPQGPGAEPDADDHQALTDWAAGNPDAFTRLSERHAPACLAIARQVLQDEDIAQDAVQGAYLELWETSQLISPLHSRLGPWLVALTHRRAVDRLRQDHRRPPSADPMPDLVREVDSKERTTRVLLGDQTVELLQQLPADQRECLMLAYWGGYTLAEVSLRLDIPVGTVKKRCVSALGRLSVLVQERGRDPRLDPAHDAPTSA